VFNVQTGDLRLWGTDDRGVLWGVESVDGWGPTGSSVTQTQRPRQPGAWSGGKFAKARAVTVKGGFEAPSPEAAQDALDRLAAAVSLEEFKLAITETTSPRWATVYQTGEIIPIWVNATEVEWSFQVASDDWRKFGEPMVKSTALPSESGGLTVPFTVPFTIAATSASGQVNLINPGNDSGPVVLRVDGPCAGPEIIHTSTGSSLKFSSQLVLGAGEYLEIDMERRTALANGQVSRAGWITSRGWSQFDPGANTWSFTATAFDPSARLTVTATPAWR
jgi:hypothetical protein